MNRTFLLENNICQKRKEIFMLFDYECYDEGLICENSDYIGLCFDFNVNEPNNDNGLDFKDIENGPNDENGDGPNDDDDNDGDDDDDDDDDPDPEWWSDTLDSQGWTPDEMENGCKYGI